MKIIQMRELVLVITYWYSSGNPYVSVRGWMHDTSSLTNADELTTGVSAMTRNDSGDAAYRGSR